MFTKTLCLAASRPVDEAAAAIEEVSRRALREIPGARSIQVNRVVRHIPTDYIENDRPYKGVVAEADEIGATVEVHFDDAAAASRAASSPAWAAWTRSLGGTACILFGLDSEPNVPVALNGSALRGGFRRWLLLTRKAPTRDSFREAWFGRHARLVKDLPLLEGYVQNLVIERFGADGKPASYEALPIDGIAEVCFADEASMNSSYGSDARLPLKDDGRDLNARVSTVLVQGVLIR